MPGSNLNKVGDNNEMLGNVRWLLEEKATAVHHVFWNEKMGFNCKLNSYMKKRKMVRDVRELKYLQWEAWNLYRNHYRKKISLFILGSLALILPHYGVD